MKIFRTQKSIGVDFGVPVPKGGIMSKGKWLKWEYPHKGAL